MSQFMFYNFSLFITCVCVYVCMHRVSNHGYLAVNMCQSHFYHFGPVPVGLGVFLSLELSSLLGSEPTRPKDPCASALFRVVVASLIRSPGGLLFVNCEPNLHPKDFDVRAINC